jgi:hypothetical protein
MGKKFISSEYARYEIVGGRVRSLSEQKSPRVKGSRIVEIASLHSLGGSSKEDVTRNSFPVTANGTTHSSKLNKEKVGYQYPLVPKISVKPNPPRSRIVNTRFNFIDNPETFIVK